VGKKEFFVFCSFYLEWLCTHISDR
jgi:hypothetical protein